MPPTADTLRMIPALRLPVRQRQGSALKQRTRGCNACEVVGRRGRVGRRPMDCVVPAEVPKAADGTSRDASEAIAALAKRVGAFPISAQRCGHSS
ncbi:hypothetical protein XFF6990_10179 [Xanthomonas citri pv. fuscans]|nr:hypothetical protein XFF6990_10179 [Xanthomonas citri pv. fuscans]